MNHTEEIKQRLPIEQLVGSYLPLRKAGRIFKACCPFHHEKTASFTVSPERNIFKCFGCGEGGDIFDFVIKMEGLTFPEAIQLLAERAGVTLEDWRPDPSFKPTSEVSKDRLFKLNAYLGKLWHAILLKHEKGETARRYLASRGLKEETLIQFQIGYAPAGPVTTKSLLKEGFTQKEITIAGDPGKFQDRVIFPIHDLTGRIVGFTGRLLDDTNPNNHGPKYWNTPETPLFNKSRAVYGIHLAKQAMQKEDRAILVEGQMDVVALHQGGYTQAVASSGTALTSDQLRLIGRFTDNIVFAYDQDKAGQEATKRGLDLVLAAELNPLVVSLSDSKDPAECLQKDPKIWEAAYQDQEPFLAWLIRGAIGQTPELTPVRKKELAKELLPWIAKITDPLEQAEWLRILAAHLQTAEDNLWEALKKQANRPTTPAPTREASQNPEPAPTTETVKLSPETKLAEIALCLILAYPDIYPAVQAQIGNLTLAGQTPFLDKILPKLAECSSVKELESKFEGAAGKEIALYLENTLQTYQEIDLDNQTALSEVMIILTRLRSASKEKTKERLAEEIKRAQLLGDQVKLRSLFSELKNLI